MFNRKHCYFTANNINEKTGNMLRSVAHLHRDNYPVFNISKAACLVIDMQRFFLEPESHAFIPSAGPVLKRILQLARLFIENKRPLYLTRHLNTPQNAGNMLHWWKDIIRPESELSRLDPELEKCGGIVIEKTQYDTFFKTQLHELLKKEDVSQLVITGVLTHLCCETTARSAFVRGYEVFLPVDATADYNELFHRSTVLNLAHGFAVPVISHELCE